LELWIVVAARALERLRPTMIKHILAAGMGLHIAGCCTEKIALGVLGEEVARLPASSAAD
jgi:hypothetical protein